MLATLAVYEGMVRRAVRTQLAAWEGTAQRIPDPVLRGSAVSALAEKGSNAEAVAVLTALAPRPSRPTAIRACTTLQVMIDYLDTLGEQPSASPLRDGLRLHLSLGAALSPGTETEDWYEHHPQQDDGGYLDRLIASCRQSVSALPSGTAILPAARRAAIRCGEGQSHTHAAAGKPPTDLESWAERQQAPPEFSWWEVAAGASSSVAAHALIALAATPEATAGEGDLVDAAYFPAIGALTVLLDDLVDREADEAAGEHSYLDYYPSAAAAADRLAAMAELGRASTTALRRSDRHAAILSGILAYYLSSDRTDTPFARPIRERMLTSSGLTVRILTKLLKIHSRG